VRVSSYQRRKGAGASLVEQPPRLHSLVGSQLFLRKVKVLLSVGRVRVNVVNCLEGKENWSRIHLRTTVSAVNSPALIVYQEESTKLKAPSRDAQSPPSGRECEAPSQRRKEG